MSRLDLDIEEPYELECMQHVFGECWTVIVCVRMGSVACCTTLALFGLQHSARALMVSESSFVYVNSKNNVVPQSVHISTYVYRIM